MLCSSCEREEWENKKENSAGTNVSEEGRGRDVPGTGAEDHGDNHAVPLQPMEDSMPQQVDMSWRKLQPMESQNRSSILPGAVVHEEETTLEQSVPCGQYPAGGTHAGDILEEQPMGRSHAGAVLEGLHLMEEIPWWSRERVWGGRNSRGELLWT